MYSELDLDWGNLGDWYKGLEKTIVLKTQNKIAIKESKQIEGPYYMLYWNTPPNSISNLVMYPRSALGGKIIFMIRLIRFNLESIDSRFLQRERGRGNGLSLIATYTQIENALFLHLRYLQIMWYFTMSPSTRVKFLSVIISRLYQRE